MSPHDGGVVGTAGPRRRPTCELTLFVSGAAPRSTAAVATVRAVCDEARPSGVRLQVRDAAADPAAARAHDVVVLPTLVATSPSPRRHLAVDLTDADQVRSWISEITAHPDPPSEVPR